MGPHDVGSWDELAPKFENEVCNVLAEDRRRTVARVLAGEARRLGAGRASRRVLAADFGCGTGRALPLLARHFEDVIAVDVSEACLAIARTVPHRPPSVTFLRADMSRPRLALSIPKSGIDLGLCINVAIMPDERVRGRILANVARHVRPAGRLLLVVPAHESQLLVRRRWTEWTGSRWRTGRHERPVEGLFDVCGAITKLWTCEELESLAPQLSCKALSIERVEYRWETEFERPPRSLRDPYPWDWLAVFERRPPR